jgi:hypothetical protein
MQKVRYSLSEPFYLAKRPDLITYVLRELAKYNFRKLLRQLAQRWRYQRRYRHQNLKVKIMTAPQVKEFANSRRSRLRSLLTKAFEIDQLKDAILWTSEGQAKELSEEEKGLLAALARKSDGLNLKLADQNYN